jgi:hypothetical protein
VRTLLLMPWYETGPHVYRCENTVPPQGDPIRVSLPVSLGNFPVSLAPMSDGILAGGCQRMANASSDLSQVQERECETDRGLA